MEHTSYGVAVVIRRHVLIVLFQRELENWVGKAGRWRLVILMYQRQFTCRPHSSPLHTPLTYPRKENLQPLCFLCYFTSSCALLLGFVIIVALIKRIVLAKCLFSC